MSFITFIANLKFLVQKILELLGYVKKEVVQHQQDSEKKELVDATKQARDATDEATKADAACRIEKVFNPDSTCVPGGGGTVSSSSSS